MPQGLNPRTRKAEAVLERHLPQPVGALLVRDAQEWRRGA